MALTDQLTDRQKRELDYHKGHASVVAASHRANYEVLNPHSRRWWNAFWDTWGFLRDLPLRGKAVLVVGCGGGDDAFLFAKLGACVSAFDLSPDMLALAKQVAEREGLNVAFNEMAAEKMTYDDATFDLIYCRDILHHVDIPQTMREIARVAKPGSLMVVNEIYSHSITEVVRRSSLVEHTLYPAMQKFVYQNKKPYITEDERKMTEADIGIVKSHLRIILRQRFFNFVVTRLVPEKYPLLSRLDRLGLMAMGPMGRFLAGRIVLTGEIIKA